MLKSSMITLLYRLFLLAMLTIFSLLLYRGNWLETDLQAILPQDKSWNDIQQKADKLQENKLNRQIIALIGGIGDPQLIFELTQQTAKKWQKSGLFSQVKGNYQPNLTQLQQEITLLSIATLPEKIRQQLLYNPAQYFEEYAQRLANPFAHSSLLPLQQDWLGFGQFTLTQAQIQSHIQWNPTSGLIYVMQGDKMWAVLQAELSENNSIDLSVKLLDLMQNSQQWLQQQQAHFLVTGASLFSAKAKIQAEQESQQLSLIGISLTLILLILVFRHWRIIWLFLPIISGLLVGVVATILAFKQIHILTLVIGTSLIGVLIDFPLHWLTSSVGYSPWQPKKAMQKLHFTFLISLCVTLLGYILLGFTNLPILQQTALFSSVALIIAICSTIWLLPAHFQHYSAKPMPNFYWISTKVRLFFQFIFSPHLAKSKLVILSILLLAGLIQTQWQDNIRQWINLNPSLLNQTQQIARLTGINLSSQYFLIIAPNDQELLEKDQKLSQRLQQYQQQGKSIHFQSLSQWIISPPQQREFVQQLKQQIVPQDYQILSRLNLPITAIEQYINQLDPDKTISLQTALNTTIGQVWRPLYLGNITPHQVASIIKVNSAENLAFLANQQDIFWQDKTNHLSKIFQLARDQAFWLKAISLILAFLLLWRLFGFKQGIKMLSVPLLAIICTLAILGWLHFPISLFAMFGLLLVSVITVDYTVYMQTVNEKIENKRLAIGLTASTSFISFALLATSTTPAVASFGLSVSIGVIFGIVFTFLLWKK